MEIAAKLEILADAAKYDASCASSGAVRKTAPSGIGNSTGMGICHSYTPDGPLRKMIFIEFWSKT